jgi:hypothetical protein
MAPRVRSRAGRVAELPTLSAPSLSEYESSDASSSREASPRKKRDAARKRADFNHRQRREKYWGDFASIEDPKADYTTRGTVRVRSLQPLAPEKKRVLLTEHERARRNRVSVTSNALMMAIPQEFVDSLDLKKPKNSSVFPADVADRCSWHYLEHLHREKGLPLVPNITNDATLQEKYGVRMPLKLLEHGRPSKRSSATASAQESPSPFDFVGNDSILPTELEAEGMLLAAVGGRKKGTSGARRLTHACNRRLAVQQDLQRFDFIPADFVVSSMESLMRKRRNGKLPFLAKALRDEIVFMFIKQYHEGTPSPDNLKTDDEDTDCALPVNLLAKLCAANSRELEALGGLAQMSTPARDVGAQVEEFNKWSALPPELGSLGGQTPYMALDASQVFRHVDGENLGFEARVVGRPLGQNGWTPMTIMRSNDPTYEPSCGSGAAVPLSVLQDAPPPAF